MVSQNYFSFLTIFLFWTVQIIETSVCTGLLKPFIFKIHLLFLNGGKKFVEVKDQIKWTLTPNLKTLIAKATTTSVLMGSRYTSLGCLLF